MKNLKILFTALLLLCCVGMATAHDFEVSGIYYRITDAKNKTVSVTYRGDYYYEYSNEYTGSVVIPENVTYNGTTYSVTSIGEWAFQDCDGLTSITIPNSVTSIGEWAFSGCSGLTSITIPNSVTSIGGGAFYGCTGLKSITIPNSVTSIGNDAFSGTAWYNNQPDGVVYAGKVLYRYKGTMPSNTSITIKDGTLGIVGGAFEDCTGLTNITIPNSVTSIGFGAFYGCTGLTSIVIPNSVTSIGIYAFSGTAWYNNQPDGVVYAGKVLYEYKGTMPSNTSITIKYGSLGIAGGAFWDCTGLTSITIPNSVTSIGDYAFSSCRGLTSVVIGNSVTSIGNSAFYECTGLTSITIPNSVTRIGEYAFEGCTGITSVTIGTGVKNIGSEAFAKCENLTNVYCLATSVPSASSNAFNESYPEYMTLHIPAEAIDSYKATAPWSSFGTIVTLNGGDYTNVTDIPAKAVLVTSSNGSINISCSLDGESVAVYTTAGTLIATTTIENGTATVATGLSKGSVAIVKIADKSIKVAVN